MALFNIILNKSDGSMQWNYYLPYGLEVYSSEKKDDPASTENQSTNANLTSNVSDNSSIKASTRVEGVSLGISNNINSLIQSGEAYQVESEDVQGQRRLWSNDESFQQYNQLATWLSERLNALDSDLSEKPDLRASLWYLFSDDNLMAANRNQQFVSLRADKPANWMDIDWSVEKMIVALPLFKAICLFLGAEERYNSLNASLAYLFAAWQRYNLAKRLTSKLSSIYNPFLEEMAAAHRLLIQLLLDSRFALALRWLAIWAGKEVDSGPLIREQLRLSLPLEWTMEKDDLGEFTPENVITAPGFFVHPKPEWEQTRLHDAFFKEESGRSAVRSLITEWLLPRYDYSSALIMAQLLRKNRLLKPLHLFWLVLLVGPMLLGIGIWVASNLLRTQGGISAPGEAILIGLVIEWVVIIFWAIIVAGFLLDRSVLAYLAAPRLTGGILIGYSALVLQGDSLNLNRLIWEQGLWLVLILAGFVGTVGLLYLYYDAYPLAHNKGKAFWRAFLVLSLAIIISCLVGLGSVALTTGMAALNCKDGPAVCSCLNPTGPVSCVFGPFGWFDLHQYTVFVPLALFTGLVTQFIFEERTVTASVWSPEEQ
jgi:hypothetical protein